MKQAHIVNELAIFFEAGNYSAARLSRESGVSTTIISRLRTGAQKDVSSRLADALRLAMRLSTTAIPPTPSAPPQPEESTDAA